MDSLKMNTKRITRDITLGTGKAMPRFTFEPEELVYDQNGIVRIIHQTYRDGSTGHYALAPNNKTADQILDFIGEWVVPFGLILAGGQLIKGRTVVPHFGRFIAINKLGGSIVRDWLDNFNLSSCSYYALDNNELVFVEPIRLTQDERKSTPW